MSTQTMTRAMYLCFAIFLSTETYLKFVDADYNKYVSLISDVRDEYMASSVFLVSSRNNSRMQKYTAADSLLRTFSRQGVFTLITYTDDLKNRLNYYRKRIGQPLVVVLLKSLEDSSEFNRSDQMMNKSYAIWLVIFDGDPDDRFCEYCRRPIGNEFRLRFDTLMLVLCCNNPTLQEWWSVHQNQTEIDSFGTWTANRRLKLLSTRSLNARRNDLRGKEIRIIVPPGWPYRFHAKARTASLQLFHELQHAMNFTLIELRPETEEVSGSNATRGSWSLAVELLTQGRADIMLFDITMVNLALPTSLVIDFTHPIVVSEMKLFMRAQNGMSGHAIRYLKVFALEVWVAIFGLAITTPLLLALLKVQHGSKSLASLYVANLFSVWGIFCQQGLYQLPAKLPMRIAIISIFITAPVVYVAYTVLLMSFLTVSKLPFSDLTGFLEDGSYKIVMHRNSAVYKFVNASTSPINKKMMMLMKPFDDLPLNRQEAWDQVCAEKVGYLVVASSEEFAHIKCNVLGIKTGNITNFALALPAGSPYTEVLNYYIERFRANGMYNRIKDRYLKNVQSVESTDEVIEFSRVAPILTVLAGGMIFALIILFAETMYHAFNHRERCFAFESRSQRTKTVVRFDAREGHNLSSNCKA